MRRFALVCLLLAGCGQSGSRGAADAGGSDGGADGALGGDATLADATPDGATTDGATTDGAPVDVGAPADAAIDARADAGGPPPCVVTVTPAETASFNALMTYVNTELASSHTPGASVAVVLHGCLAFTGAAGVRNTASGAPVTTSTLFRAGSMSKMLLAATAMSLVRDGALDVHLPITRYLPWFSLASGYDASTITLDHLLSHSSGFPGDTINQCGGGINSGTRDAFFRTSLQPLWFPPGAAYDYSNTGYTLASEVLTAAAGLDNTQYETLVHDRVFVPAGMTHATFDAAGVTASADHATGYVLSAATGAVLVSREPTSFDCPLVHPSGGVLATPTDYAHFVEAMLAGGGGVLNAAGVSTMEAPHISTRAVPTQAYGYGLAIQFSPFPTHRSVLHDGEVPGYHAFTWMVPDSKFAVVVMVNATGYQDAATAIASHAIPLFISDPETLPPLTTPSSSWDPYVGTYNDSTGTLGAGVVVSLVPPAGVTRVLQVDAPNAHNVLGTIVPVHGAMTQVAADLWSMPDGTYATFFPDAGGTFRYFVTRRGVATR